MSYLMLARNVLNTDEISKFISMFDYKNKEDIKKWLTSSLKKYLINDYTDTTLVTSAPPNSPEWLQKALDDEKEVFKVNFTPELKSKIDHIIDWLNSLSPNDLKSVYKISFEQAEEKAEQWLEKLHKNAGEEEDFDGIKEILKVGSNTWVKVTSKQALNREGLLMEHCVGGDDYCDAVEKDEVDIYSLRDSSNKPHCTIEYYKEGKEIKQIKGKKNGPVNPKYIEDIRKFLKVIPYNDINLDQSGLIEYQKAVYSKYALPSGFKTDYLSYEGGTNILKIPNNVVIDKLQVTRIQELVFGNCTVGSLNIVDATKLDVQNCKVTKLNIQESKIENIVTIAERVQIKESLIRNFVNTNPDLSSFAVALCKIYSVQVHEDATPKIEVISSDIKEHNLKTDIKFTMTEVDLDNLKPGDIINEFTVFFEPVTISQVVFKQPVKFIKIKDTFLDRVHAPKLNFFRCSVHLNACEGELVMDNCTKCKVSVHKGTVTLSNNKAIIKDLFVKPL